MFCVVGLDNATFTSSVYTTVDGTSFIRATTPWDAVTSGVTGVYQRPDNGMLIVTRRAGGTGVAQFLSSSDLGVTWTERHISQSSLENGYQAYEPVWDPVHGVWVCIGANTSGWPAVFTSADITVPGSGWTDRTPSGVTRTGIASATDGAGTTVIVCGASYIRIPPGTLPSPAALTTMPGSGSGADIVWAGGSINLFVMVGHFSAAGIRVVTSPDGVTWTNRSLPGDAADNTHSGWCGAVGWNGTMLVALGKVAGAANVTSTHAYTSTDGVTWTDQGSAGFGTAPLDQGGFAGGVAWDGTRWGAIYDLNGNGVAGNTWSTSLDGITWTNKAAPFVANNNLDVTGILNPASGKSVIRRNIPMSRHRGRG